MTGSHPERIAKYEVTDLLGEGAMGVVYRAMDTVLKRYVAIKLMTTGIARDSDLRARFLREAQAAGSLEHPNIVTIYDFGEAGDQLYIAMQYIEGADLTEVIQRQQPLPLHAQIDIILDVLNGLAYAHRRGIIHRDIKPANIRISADGRAHIMDFGIARLSESSMTRSGVLVGTPDYMSPEQVTGGEVTPASDIFSVGVVFYELLTHAKPFKAETLHSVLYKIVSEQPRALNEIIPGISPALQNIVSKALAKDPAERYASAHAMVEDLTQFRLAMSGGSAATIAVRRTPLRTLAQKEDGSIGARLRTRHFLAAAALILVVVSAVVWGLARDSDRQTPDVAASESARVSPISSDSIVPAGNSRPEAAPSAAAPDMRAAPGPRTPTTGVGTTQATRRAGADSVTRTGRSGVAAIAERSQRSSPANVTRASAPPVAAATTAGAAATPPSTAVTSAPPPPAATSAPAAAPAVTSPAEKSPDAESAAKDASLELQRLIDAFEKAVESMSIAQLRSAYPGMTPAQQAGWEQFFGSVRALRAELAVSRADVDGATAEIRVTGTYTYEGRNGKQDRQPVAFVATARREGAVWRLIAMR